MMDRVIARDVLAERNYEGAWVLSAIVDGYSHCMRYYGYTKREAMRRFLRTINAKVRGAR